MFEQSSTEEEGSVERDFAAYVASESKMHPPLTVQRNNRNSINSLYAYRAARA
jgi:hypothetical protein